MDQKYLSVEVYDIHTDYTYFNFICTLPLSLAVEEIKKKEIPQVRHHDRQKVKSLDLLAILN